MLPAYAALPAFEQAYTDEKVDLEQGDVTSSETHQDLSKDQNKQQYGRGLPHGTFDRPNLFTCVLKRISFLTVALFLGFGFLALVAPDGPVSPSSMQWTHIFRFAVPGHGRHHGHGPHGKVANMTLQVTMMRGDEAVKGLRVDVMAVPRPHGRHGPPPPPHSPHHGPHGPPHEGHPPPPPHDGPHGPPHEGHPPPPPHDGPHPPPPPHDGPHGLPHDSPHHGPEEDQDEEESVMLEKRHKDKKHHKPCKGRRPHPRLLRASGETDKEGLVALATKDLPLWRFRVVNTTAASAEQLEQSVVYDENEKAQHERRRGPHRPGPVAGELMHGMFVIHHREDADAAASSAAETLEVQIEQTLELVKRDVLPEHEHSHPEFHFEVLHAEETEHGLLAQATLYI